MERGGEREGGEPRCTPTVVDGLVYAVSYDGEVLCCQASDGKPVWKKEFPKGFWAAGEPGWGFSESPLVDGDRVILIPGDDEHFMVALNRKTGAVIWETKADLKGSGHDGAGYTGAVVSMAGGSQTIRDDGRQGRHRRGCRATANCSGITIGSPTAPPSFRLRSSGTITSSFRAVTAPARRCSSLSNRARE